MPELSEDNGQILLEEQDRLEESNDSYNKNKNLVKFQQQFRCH